MAPSDDLNTILEKIADGNHTDADIAALRQLLRTGDRQIALQLGKYNVNIGQGQNIEIGDRIYQELNEEAIQAIVLAIRKELQAPSRLTEISGRLHFRNEWFSNHLQEAARAAKPRYTPELSVDVPIAIAFEALGKTPQWEVAVRKLIKKVDNVTKQWSRGLSQSNPDPATPNFPAVARESAELLATQLSSIGQTLSNLITQNQETNLISELDTSVAEALDLASRCLSVAVEDLEAKHGEGRADSASFRQFMAEYELSFPAQHVDAAREVIGVLEELRNWLNEPQARLPMSSAMLLLGPAGIGKTHAICDMALDRHKRGLRSIVLLGEQFVDGEPWGQICQLLGLSATLSRDELLEALNTAGELTGYPLIIFIDALNETRPRDVWYTHLARVIEPIIRHTWLKLCISCRSTYYEDVIAPNVQIPEVEHRGFEGVEFDACFDFFRFYGLEPPSMPLMQPEFFNPLFLRLVCESLSDAGVKQLPDGMVGISEVVRYLLDSKNKKLARVLDYHPREQCLQRALNLLITTMSETEASWLPWFKAKELVDSIRPSQQRSLSLFDQMLREGVISEDRVAAPSETDAQDAIRFSFERLSDHLLAKKYLAEISECSLPTTFLTGGLLHFSVSDKEALRKNRGLLEALAIQIPEKYGLELTEVVSSASSRKELILALIESLIWRDSSSLGQKTDLIIKEALSRSETFAPTMEALFALSTRTGNPLNSLWFHKLFSTIPMPDRDAALCPYLYRTYGQLKGIDRLLRWALNADLGAVSDETAELWVTQLCWFCVASDRRVRDYATKAIIRIMEGHVMRWPVIIKRFTKVGDEYVIERCLAAAYGSLIRANHNDAIGKTAKTVYEVFFENKHLPINAMVRDYARLILELAAHRNELPNNISPEQFRPPYESKWPLDWPDEAFIEQYRDSSEEFPKLYRSCMEDDFAVYTVSSPLYGYDEREISQARPWIFKHVLDMGYTRYRFANFDGFILYKYGGGRAKPSWAERIGKKYQWIALYRLMAHVADHLEKERSQWDPPPPSVPELQALGERNIDPTVLFKKTQSTRSSAWWTPVDYDFKSTDNLSDEEWLDLKDFPDSAEMLRVKDPSNGREWLVLEAYPEWNSRNKENLEDKYPYRICWMQVRSYLVKQTEQQKCWNWLPHQNFMGRWMPEGLSLHDGFLGEYPWGVPFVQFFEQYGSTWSQESEIPFHLLPTVNSVSFEWDFDAYQEENFNILVPAKVFFDSDELHWNLVSGYKSNSGRLCFNYPATLELGPSALLVDKEYLEEFLKNNDLVMIWTILAEKHCIHSFSARHNLGRAEYSRTHMLTDGQLRSSEGIINRIKPEV